MEPLPETVEAVRELEKGRLVSDDLLGSLLRLAEQALEIVPDLMGVSVARLDEEVAFTVVASAAEIAVLDAVQYAAGGPCVDGAVANRVREFEHGDVLDEE